MEPGAAALVQPLTGVKILSSDTIGEKIAGLMGFRVTNFFLTFPAWNETSLNKLQ